jgi:tetratricopeptide (TPR) repeat protein
MRWSFASVLAAVSALSTAASSTVAGDPPDSDAVLLQAQRLREAGQVQEAIAKLEQAYEELPTDEQVAVALAQAYLADDNQMWAIRTLARHLDYEEDACSARSLLAWIYLSAGMTEAADGLLAFEGCESPRAVHTRWLLIRAYAAHLREQPEEVQELLKQARRSGSIYAEDEALLTTLSRIYEPGRTPLAAGHLELGAGWTSNGLAGSPVDEASVDNAASGVVELDARLRLTLPTPGVLKPLVEGRLQTTELTAQESSDLSHRTGTGRAGFSYGDSTRIELLYGGELTQIAAGDRYQSGPLWFSEAHRLEYQLQLGSALVLFGATGHRQFRERGRTRWEFEQGVAWAVPASWGAAVLGGISGRIHDAEKDAYERSGATFILQLKQPVLQRVELRLGTTTSVDVYPKSDGYFAAGKGIRRDLELRLRAGAWAPRRSSAMVGLTYELTNRHSSADEYSFADHRLLAKLRFTSDSEQLRRRVVSTKGRTELEIRGLDASDGEDASEIRELIEQDESVRSSSTCLK